MLCVSISFLFFPIVFCYCCVFSYTRNLCVKVSYVLLGSNRFVCTRFVNGVQRYYRLVMFWTGPWVTLHCAARKCRNCVVRWLTHTQVVNESHTGKWVRDDMQIFSHSICLKKRASPGKRVSLSFSLSAVVMFWLFPNSSHRSQHCWHCFWFSRTKDFLPRELYSGLLHKTTLIPFENLKPRPPIIATWFKEAEIHISGVQSLPGKI